MSGRNSSKRFYLKNFTFQKINEQITITHIIIIFFIGKQIKEVYINYLNCRFFIFVKLNFLEGFLVYLCKKIDLS